MTTLVPVPSSFIVVVPMSAVYAHWKVAEPDAWQDMRLAFMAIWDAGIRPWHVEFDLRGSISMHFPDWNTANEADKAIKTVCDLLWLMN